MAAPAAAAERPGSLAGRLLFAALWVTIGKLLGFWLAMLPLASLLGTTSVTLVSAAILFGWVGVAVGTVLQLIYVVQVEGLGTYAWVSTAGYAAAATLAWLAFRHVPRLSRRFADPLTVAWFALAGATGAVLSAGLITLFGDHTDDIFGQVALWSRSTIVSVWAFCPALVIAGERLLQRFLAPIPGEPLPSPARRFALVEAALPGQPVQVTGVETHETGFGRLLAEGALITAGIAAAKLLLADAHGHDHAWWNLLFLVPIWWLARLWRLPGALLGAALASAGTLGTESALLLGTAPPPAVAVGLYAQLLACFLVAVLLGASAEREGRLLEGLAELHGRVAQDLQRVVKALTGAVAAKDEYTEGHLHRVSAYAVEVGRRLSLAGPQLELLQIASTLHDIGKIGIPESLLNKPGPLLPDERAVLQRHPEIGARMLSRIDGLREAAPLVLHHQERWDGARDGAFPGYPAGLAGEAIPLGARIIAVVDAFDAMTTDRPYRSALSNEHARAALAGESGRQFDPLVVATFLALLDERPWR